MLLKVLINKGLISYYLLKMYEYIKFYNMVISEMIEMLQNKKDEHGDIYVGLIDTTTDDFDAMNYPLDSCDVLDCVKDEGDEPTAKGLFFYFENSLNENPI